MPAASFPSNTMTSDDVLTQQVTQGNQEAFRILFNRYRMEVYRFCLLMVGKHAAAEDIYQEAFISLYRACRRGETIYHVRAYLLTAARRRCLNYLRTDGKYVALDEVESVAYEMKLDEIGVDVLLKEALQKIPPQYRESFLLFEIEGYSYQEIATCLDVSLDIVRNRIYRAKKNLQKILDPILDAGIDRNH